MKYLPGVTDPAGIGLASLMAIMLAGITTPAGADAVYQLDVTYTSGSIVSGPLSFGLGALPASVTATFTLGAGQPGSEPGEENDIYFDDEDVVSASVTFGDTSWTESTLEVFSLVYGVSTGGSGGEDRLTGLGYRFLPNPTMPCCNRIVLNFPLTITGTDEASGESFHYEYTESTQTISAISQTLAVAIDIKPGSDPNCFNINGHGVIPVAILGGEGFVVSQIDQATLSFGGLAVRVRGNKGASCSIEYANGDAYLDLVCQFEDDAANWEAGDGAATLTGNLLDGSAFEGTDTICVVP